MALTNDDIKLIGEEMVRALEPVYEDLDSVKHTLNEHTDKIDALTADMVQAQDELGAIKDDLRNVKDEVGIIKDDLRNVKDEVGIIKDDVRDIKEGLEKDKKNHQKEHQLIRKHIGIPAIAHQITVKNK